VKRRMAQAAFLLAAAAVLVPLGKQVVDGDAGFPGWPTEFEGRVLVEERLQGFEESFGAMFPGRMAKFRAGGDVVLMRWTREATHRVHPTSVCLGAAGWKIEPLALARRDDGDWSSFRAERGSVALRVREQVRAADGTTFPDVSAWFLRACLGLSRGPWLAVTVVESARDERPLKP